MGVARFILEDSALDDFQREIVGLLPRLRRFARALTNHVADADDLTQVAIERALRQRNQWTAGTRLDSWTFRIMKNAWIDESRSRQRRARVTAAAEEGENVSDAGIASLETRIEAGRVAAAMNRLPEEQRLAVALVLVDGLSYREAAEALQIPEGTLTSRLVRGRMALQEQMRGGA